MTASTLLLSLLIATVTTPVAFGHGNGAPDTACRTLQPSAIYHGSPQDSDANPPPFVMKIADQSGFSTKTYKADQPDRPKIYTVTVSVRPNSEVTFKGFALQARVGATDDGKGVGLKRVGQFIQDATWLDQGVQFQGCSDGVNDSVTHTNSRPRTTLSLKWHSLEVEGPVQFVMTIVENKTHFWSRWAPKTGYLSPETNVVQPSEKHRSQEGSEKSNSDRLAVNKQSQSEKQFDKEKIQQPSRSKDNDFNIDSVLPDGLNSGGRKSIVTSTEATANVSVCSGSPCKNGGICHTATGGGFRCECDSGWAGPFCEKSCPSSNCRNGGTCILDSSGSFGCTCAPGYTGTSCSTEINECASSPCANGGSCTDRVNGFWCTCKTGYTGQRCHRPCQNVYKSCERWKEEDRCENMRKLTKFFDANCPVACDQCNFDNATIVDYPPFPPALEPFHFLLGNWVGKATTRDHFPLDFDSSTGSNGYSEEINFEVAEVPMFGTPSVNYSCISKSFGNPTDQQIIAGYLTLKRSPGTTKQAALLTTSNNGIIMIEEGAVTEGVSVEMKAVFNATLGYLKYRVPKQSTRLFVIDGNFLRVKTNLVDYEGRTREFYTFYNRIKGRNLY